MKNSLKISSNFSIPWLGAFIVTCVLLETSVCGSSFERSIEQKNWGDCAYCMRLLTISNLYNILYQHKCFSASTDSHLGAEIETLTLHAKFYGKIAWLLLHNYIKEVVWSQFIYHIQISAILPSNKNIRMKFGRGSCSVNAGESLENLSLSFRRSEALDKEKNAVVFILFLYQPIKVLDRISKKTVICWMIHRGASHMIVQAIAAKLQWFISQELQSSRWVTLGAFGTLPPRNNDLAMYIGFIFKKNSDTLPKTNISSIPLIIFGW